ncbi:MULTISPECIES: DUF447 domain-containing protein [Halolamina]|uniref:DUF447 family protein n=1 Tax=Halolamina pelagica TaxID=699431 RepID=A0A1I5V555_9EURY|nr:MULTISPECIES: DUF447 domain-containing protein [Halolamina]NHX37893.1 DUF447 family protein [Halolamina sp. R1-12]SFQ02477.1 hypothetical protein SAMN05216277_11623 [Halolamina pelagica]
MTAGPAGGEWEPEDAAPDGWPVPLRGVTESVIATKGPNGLWNVAALGLHAGDPVTAETYGNTRTRRNFERRGGGVVQFVADPRAFVDAALTIREADDPVLPSADAWVEVEAAFVGSREEGETTIREWELRPGDGEVVREGATTINRGFGAVIEATVAASRLGVAGFDDADLRARLDSLADVVDRCGGAREREAMARVAAASEWERPEN